MSIRKQSAEKQLPRCLRKKRSILITLITSLQLGSGALQPLLPTWDEKAAAMIGSQLFALLQGTTGCIALIVLNG
jgi:hypothetical protein